LIFLPVFILTTFLRISYFWSVYVLDSYSKLSKATADFYKQKMQCMYNSVVQMLTKLQQMLACLHKEINNKLL